MCLFVSRHCLAGTDELLACRCLHRLRSTSDRSADFTRCLRVQYCVSRAPTLILRCVSSVATSSLVTRYRSWRVAPSGHLCCHTSTTLPHFNRSTCTTITFSSSRYELTDWTWFNVLLETLGRGNFGVRINYTGQQI